MDKKKNFGSGKFLYDPIRNNVFSIDIVKLFRFDKPHIIWIDTWDGSTFSLEDYDCSIKRQIIKWTKEES